MPKTCKAYAFDSLFDETRSEMEKKMNRDIRPISSDVLRDLAQVSSDEVSDSPLVTIYLPTEKKGRDTNQNRIRWKNVIDQVEQRMHQLGIDGRFLHPLHDLSNDYTFWQHQGTGLAAYVADEDVRFYRLPFEVKQAFYVGSHYFLKPIARLVEEMPRCLVIALSWEQTRLYQADREGYEEIDDEHFPVTFFDLVTPRDPEEQLQYSRQGAPSKGGTRGELRFHGHGEGEDKIRADRLQYLTRVGQRLEQVRQDVALPIVAVATKEVLGHFKSHLNIELLGTIEGSSDGSDIDRYLEQAVDFARRAKHVDETVWRERYGLAASQQKSSEDLEEILLAALDGRIETLMVDPSQSRWGKFDREKRTVRIDQKEDKLISAAGTIAGENARQELANQAILETLRTGGKIVEMSPEALPPGSAPVAAIFRY